MLSTGLAWINPWKNVSNSTTATVSKTTWVGTTYLFMLTTVGAMKTNISMILSAYFGHMSFSIFTACCYFRDSEDNLMSKSITTTSELPNHSRTSAITCASKVREKYQENVTEKYQYLPLWINAFVWRDGCGAQFRSRYVFTLLSTFDISVNLTWHYNERHHSKGPMDGIDGT